MRLSGRGRVGVSADNVAFDVYVFKNEITPQPKVALRSKWRPKVGRKWAEMAAEKRSAAESVAGNVRPKMCGLKWGKK